MPDYFTKHGVQITPVSGAILPFLFERAQNDYALQPAMIAESAGFSLSMVIRYALGLSAYEGRTFVLVSESVEGCVALAGLRQLVNAGVDAGVLLLAEPKGEILWYEQSLAALDKLDVPLVLVEPILETEFEGLLNTCHNLIIGTSEGTATALMPKICDILNDNAIPCHSVGIPPGITRSDGKLASWALFSSSTLALGVPDDLQAKYLDNIGRWYVADCSLPKPLYTELGLEAPVFFAEQPVIEIIKKQQEE